MLKREPEKCAQPNLDTHTVQKLTTQQKRRLPSTRKIGSVCTHCDGN